MTAGRRAARLSILLLATTAACGGGDGSGEVRLGGVRSTAEDSAERGLRVSDGELRSFVRVSERLEGLRRQMLADIQSAADADERGRIRERFRDARDSLLRRTRLDGAERYREIRDAVETDDELRERWRRMRRKLRAGSGSR